MGEEDNREEDDGSGWLMGKEGGLMMMEASPSSSIIRLIDPCRGVDIEVICECYYRQCTVLFFSLFNAFVPFSFQKITVPVGG